MKTVIISPHLDDAAFSAGQFIAAQDDVTVVSVFAGIPVNSSVLTAYDTKYHFGSAAEACETRRAEDIAAQAMLGAAYVHLPFSDNQYGEHRSREEIKVSIHDRVQQADRILAPLGLLHPDHILVRELVFELFNRGDFPPLRLYEDLPYRVTNPEAVFETTEAMRMQGYQLTYDGYPDLPLAPKLAAIMCYKSQLGGDINLFNLCVPERFWDVPRRRG